MNEKHFNIKYEELFSIFFLLFDDNENDTGFITLCPERFKIIYNCYQ